VDSSDSSCSRTIISDPVRGSPQIVEVCKFLILHL